jgi:predicted GTPase
MEKQILVIGKHGVGKSSVINCLSKKNSMNITNGALNLKDTIIENVDVKYNNNYYSLCELIGINIFISNENKIDEENELWKLLEDLISYLSINLPNLIIFVIERGRITENDTIIFKTIVEHITMNLVPVIIVVTGLENQLWIDQNVQILEKNFKFNDIIGSNFISTNLEKNQYIRKKIWLIIEEHSLKVKHVIRECEIERIKQDTFNYWMELNKSYMDLYSYKKNDNYCIIS